MYRDSVVLLTKKDAQNGAAPGPSSRPASTPAYAHLTLVPNPFGAAAFVELDKSLQTDCIQVRRFT